MRACALAVTPRRAWGDVFARRGQLVPRNSRAPRPAAAHPQCKLFNVQHQAIFALINALDADRTSGAALKTLVEFVVRGARGVGAGRVMATRAHASACLSVCVCL